MPSTISVGVTPRCDWARTWPTRARAPTRATIAIFFIVGSFGRTWLGVRVHGVDDVLVLDVDEGTAELHGRRQLLVLRGEDLLDEPELLDGLHPRELLVHPLDLAPDQVLHLGGPAEGGEVGEGYVLFLGELGHRLVVDHDQAGEELALIADDHRVRDEGRELELVLDLGGRDVIASRGDDDVLHAVGDGEEAVLIEHPHVPRSEPAVGDRLRRLLRVLEVAEEDVGSAEEDLALRGNAYLGVGAGYPDRAELDPARGHAGGQAAVLCLAIDFPHVDAESEIPADQLGRDGGGASGGGAGTMKPERALDVVEHEEIGEAIEETEGSRRPSPLDATLGHSSAHPDGPAVGDLAQPRRLAHAEGHRGVELLPDARHGEEYGGGDLADVLGHGVDALREVHGGAGVERIEDAEGPLGHVRERQKGELLIARAGLREEVGEADLEEDVAVAQHGAL